MVSPQAQELKLAMSRLPVGCSVAARNYSSLMSSLKGIKTRNTFM